MGLLAKNDPIDARLPTRFAQASHESLRTPRKTPPALAALRELLRARDELIEQIKNETRHAGHPATLATLNKQAAALRSISGGRPWSLRDLYMAAISAARQC